MTEIDTKVYAGKLKDKKSLLHSSSGGAFVALSDAFLDNGDAVICAVYNYQTHAVEYQLVETHEEREGAFVKIEGEKVSIKNYVRVFYNCCAVRPSCYECPYATTERKTDITIGDFWHIEKNIPDFYDLNGNFLFLLHTDRGEVLFDKIKENLDYRLSDTKQCWQANLEAPTIRPDQRATFWNDYQRKGVDFIMNKYGTTPLAMKIKNKIVKLISIGGQVLIENIMLTTPKGGQYNELETA